MLYIFIIIFLLILSYIGFKIYRYTGILKVIQKDEFTKFKRNNVQTGSGIVFFIIFLIFSYTFNIFEFFEISFTKDFFFLSLTSITALSFLDDKYNLDPLLRFSAHLIITYIALPFVPNIAEFLPTKLNILIVLVAWVYIINITNFLDGADGFCTILALGFFANTILICNFINIVNYSFYISVILIPILLIFLFFNYPPAKLFMGDTGSIFLGFLIGYIVVELSHGKYLILIISAFAYPLLDATITLFRRMTKGFFPWARLGDFYFLKPKRQYSYNKNFILVEKKIFLYGLIHSFLGFLIIFISLKLDLYYFSLLNFLTALIIIRTFDNYNN